MEKWYFRWSDKRVIAFFGEEINTKNDNCANKDIANLRKCIFAKFVPRENLISLLRLYIIAVVVFSLNWRIQNPFVGPPEMTFGLTKDGTLRNVIMFNVNRTNQKTESFVLRWLRAHAMFDVRRFFPHLLEHRPSFLALCRYVNCYDEFHFLQYIQFLVKMANQKMRDNFHIIER